MGSIYPLAGEPLFITSKAYELGLRAVRSGSLREHLIAVDAHQRASRECSRHGQERMVIAHNSSASRHIFTAMGI
jgi:hypothetical protein